jgi:hypothetical protein
MSWVISSRWLSESAEDDKIKGAPNVCHGIEESVKYVIDIMAMHGPFDGILSFS